MKDFVFVKFTNGTSDIIYKDWLNGESKCRWPPNGTNVQALVKRKVGFQNNCEVYDCLILCASSELNRICMHYVRMGFYKLAYCFTDSLKMI